MRYCGAALLPVLRLRAADCVATYNVMLERTARCVIRDAGACYDNVLRTGNCRFYCDLPDYSTN